MQSIGKRTFQRSETKNWDAKDKMGHMDPIQTIAAGTSKAFKAGYLNSAFVLIKPHANTKSTQDYVRWALQAHGLAIDSEGTIDNTEIEEKQLIGNQYYAIASKATILKAAALPVLADKFDVVFGTSWESVRFAIFLNRSNLARPMCVARPM